MRRFAAYLAIILTGLALFSPHATSEPRVSEDLIAWWRSHAPTCTAPDGFLFPSKKRKDGSCDDGDITLFAGLLCASGEQIGCDSVKRSQAVDGQWFRSPRRLQTDNLGDSNSFSPDMALGAQHYLAISKDIVAFENWLNWLDSHRPCIIGSGDHCVRSLLLRFCTNDPEKGCTLRPGDIGVLASTAAMFDRWPPTPDIKNLLLQARTNIDDIILAAAQFNSPGYSQHLPAVEIFLMRRLGFSNPKLDASAQILARKQPSNPFFRYLSDGPSQSTIRLLTDKCPKPGDALPDEMIEWSWERADSEEAWKKSMLWDCIFMAKVLNAQ